MQELRIIVSSSDLQRVLKLYGLESGHSSFQFKGDKLELVCNDVPVQGSDQNGFVIITNCKDDVDIRELYSSFISILHASTKSLLDNSYQLKQYADEQTVALMAEF